MDDTPTLYVVDDDQFIRTAICALARSMNVQAEAFCSAEEFLEGHSNARPACLITDIRMRGMSGLELQEKLRELNIHMPVIVVTAYATTPVTVRAMQNGALTVLEKPFYEHELWDAIREALAKAENERAKIEREADLRRRIEGLTPLQHEVMELIVAGKQNKEIAQKLDIGIRTVESRRREVFERMEAESVAALVRCVIQAGK